MTARAADTPFPQRSRSGVDAWPRDGQNVLRIVLGSRLRRLREEAGITQRQAGEAIRAPHSKISQLEGGQARFEQRDISNLLTLYGIVTESDRDALLTKAANADKPGWWVQYHDVIPAWFERYLGLEQAATHIRSYEPQFVPGLLQSEGYARALVQMGHPFISTSELERRVRLRMIRQRIMTGPDAPQLWAVVDEAALHRPLGGRAVMREQLHWLAEAAALPNVTLQVMPLRRGGAASSSGAFSILRSFHADLPDVVYLEQLTNALYVDTLEESCLYRWVMDRLCVGADPPSETPRTLTRLLGEFPGLPRQPLVPDVGEPPADRAGATPAKIYRQARDHAIDNSAESYDVEKGLQELNQRIHQRRTASDDCQDPE